MQTEMSQFDARALLEAEFVNFCVAEHLDRYSVTATRQWLEHLFVRLYASVGQPTLPVTGPEKTRRKLKAKRHALAASKAKKKAGKKK